MFEIHQSLELLASGQDLPEALSQNIFTGLLQGKMTPAQTGALLLGLRIKGETASELAAAVQAALAVARLIPDAASGRKSIDTCGTGGDNRGSFNCSTAVALYLAAMGHAVVKHGNRGVSSQCGSADVIESLGLPLRVEPDDVIVELAQRNFVFLFAPDYHPAFAKLAPLRRELGVRTLFNLLGPLLNPARPTHQLLGVPKKELVPVLAETLLRTSSVRGAVVHGAGGFDELTPWGPATVFWVDQKGLRGEELSPQDVGILSCNQEDALCRDKEHALAVMRQALMGQAPLAVQEMLAFNLGMALHLLEDSLGLQNAISAARAAVQQGVARRFLHA